MSHKRCNFEREDINLHNAIKDTNMKEKGHFLVLYVSRNGEDD